MPQQQVSIVLNAIPQMAGIRSFVAGIMGIKNATGTAAGAMMAAGRAMSSAIAPLTAALSVAGLVRFTKAAVDAADATAKDAQAAGIAVDQFSRLAYVGNLARASHEQLIVATKGLAQWMTKTGQDSRPMMDVLLEQADLFQRMPDGANKLRLAMERFGRSGQQLIPMLNQGSAAIRDQMEEAEIFGATVGPRFAKNAQQFNDNLTRFATIFRGIFNLLADALLPTFIEWQEAMLKWVKETGVHIGLVDTLIQSYQLLAITVAQVGLVFSTVKQGWASLGAMAGGLAGGAGFTEAAKMADAQITSLADYKAKIAKIMGIGRKPDKDTSGPVAYQMTPVDSLQQIKMQLEDNELSMKSVSARVSLSESQRNKHLVDLYKIRMRLLQSEREEISKLVPKQDELVIGEGEGARYTEAYAKVHNELNKSLAETYAITAKLSELETDDFFSRLSEGIKDITEEFDNLGATIADVMVNGIRRSIDTVSNGLWQVIDGTATWGELFTQVARSVISDLIKVGIQEILLHNLKKGLIAAWGTISSMWKAKDAATTVAAESTKTPVLATNSLLSSISSWGLAAAVGLAAVVAAMAAFGAFEQGGVVRGGRQLIQVNEAGTESVLNARATAMLGEARVNALNAGIASSLSSPGPSSGAVDFAGTGVGTQPTKLTIVLVDDRNSRAAIDAIESSEGRVVLARVMREQKMEIGIQ